MQHPTLPGLFTTYSGSPISWNAAMTLAWLHYGDKLWSFTGAA